jgi:two-component system chemotaxis response regulator CheY
MTRKAMTVDDSKTMREMVAFSLKSAGFHVLEAEDGQAALNGLMGQKVDVIITDLNMPVMDGIELIRRLRADPAHRYTPILMLTTESDGSKKMLGKEAGATGWLVKPFNPEKLIETVRKVCP